MPEINEWLVKGFGTSNMFRVIGYEFVMTFPL